MPSITVKNIPDQLYSKLKDAANAHHRSVNSELIFCLEQALLPTSIDASEALSKAHLLRDELKGQVFDIDDISDAILSGRS